MAKKLGAWGSQFLKLKRGGMTKKNLESVFTLLNSTNSFRTNTIASSARKQLNEVHKTKRK